MKYVRFICIYLVAITILVISLTGFTGCTGDDVETTIIAPTFEGIGELPLEVTIEQVYAEYMADEVTADAKYKGEKLLFYGVTVEEVGIYVDVSEGIFIHNTHIITGSVKFTPKYVEYLDNVREGFVVDIVGSCRGLIWPPSGEPLLQIGECWVNTIEGEIIEDWYPDY